MKSLWETTFISRRTNRLSLKCRLVLRVCQKVCQQPINKSDRMMSVANLFSSTQTSPCHRCRATCIVEYPRHACTAKYRVSHPPGHAASPGQAQPIKEFLGAKKPYMPKCSHLQTVPWKWSNATTRVTKKNFPVPLTNDTAALMLTVGERLGKLTPTQATFMQLIQSCINVTPNSTPEFGA